jgi:16S rRNA (adenine1518-N6/adenine1519-N6)-dimethyltransferase
MVGMFQKEVADRIVAPPGSKVYGITSVLAQAFYRTEYLFTVERGSFNPPPRVLSAVIRLTRKENFDLGCDEQLFRQVVKTAFNQRRKMLRNTLKPFFQGEILMQDTYFEKRPEQLGWEEFAQLTKRIGTQI